MHIQPVTCLLRKSSSGAYRHQSLKNSYHLLFLGKRKLLSAYQGFQRSVAAFYDLSDIPFRSTAQH